MLGSFKRCVEELDPCWIRTQSWVSFSFAANKMQTKFSFHVYNFSLASSVKYSEFYLYMSGVSVRLDASGFGS